MLNMKNAIVMLFVLLLQAANGPLRTQTAPAPAEPPLTPAEFSVWSQRMDMTPYVGKKYRLSGAVRAERNDNPEALATLFIRNEPPEGGFRSWVYMDNMMDRPVRDSTWKTYTIEYAVDTKASWICFGMLAYSRGTFYYDDLRLSVETTPGTWTEIPIPNGNFENESLAPWEQTAQGLPVRVLGASAVADTHRPFTGDKCLRISNNFLRK